MRDALSYAEEFAIVFLYQLLESGYIPILAGMDKIQVIACYCPHFELYGVCRHIGLSRLNGTTALWKQLMLRDNRKSFPLQCDLEA
jgi:hypothetical protein